MFTVSGRVTYSEVCVCARAREGTASDTCADVYLHTCACFFKEVYVNTHGGQIVAEQLPVTVYSFYCTCVRRRHVTSACIKRLVAREI